MQWSAGLDEEGNIIVRIRGILDVESARDSAKATVDLLGGASRELHIQADELEGYQQGARVTWQQNLWHHRSQIPRIRLFDANSRVRMNTSVIAMSLGIPLKASGSGELQSARALR